VLDLRSVEAGPTGGSFAPNEPSVAVSTTRLDLLHSFFAAVKIYSGAVPKVGGGQLQPQKKEVSMNSLQAVGLTFANNDVNKMWFKFPSLNVGALLEEHGKNVVALTKANQVVFDGLTTLARRERDLFKSTIDDCTKVTGEVLTGGSVEERAKRQVDGAGRIYASSVAHFVELSDIAVKTNVSAVDIFNARVIEMFDEFRALFTGRGKTATSAEPSITAEPIALVEEVALIENAVPAVPSIPTGIPRTARAAKASKTSASGSKAGSRIAARAAKTRRGSSRK